MESNMVNEEIVNAEMMESKIEVPVDEATKWHPDTKSILVGGLGAAAAIPALAYGVITLVNKLTPEDKKARRAYKRLEKKEKRLEKDYRDILNRKAELNKIINSVDDVTDDEEE